MQPVYSKLSGIDIATYERPAKGQAIIFVHGNSSNAHAFEQMWNSPHLSGFHLLAFDLPGHGNSEKAHDPESYRFVSLSKILAEFIELRKPENPILLCHSLGGHIGIHALELTQRVAGLMLVGTAPLHHAGDIPKGYNLLPDVMALFKNEVSDEELEKALILEVHKATDKQIVRDSFKIADGRCREILGSEFSLYFDSPAFVSEIKLLGNPRLRVAFALGEHEQLINREYLQQLGPVAFWKNKVQLIPDAGHCAVFENPEYMAKLLSGFMAG